MWSIPLDAPLTILPLKDPVVEWIVTSPTLTKDLFFSGHTSTLFLMALLASRLKPLYFLATFFVAVCVLLQHVHYLVDVLVAPFVAYAAFKIVHTIKDKIRI
jgi:membrane-associated phospholipid phosphatase